MTGWAKFETALMVTAVRQAPSVHHTRPWVLELHQRGAALFERIDRAPARLDPTGRDRLISCGAALTNLRLAVRFLGWDTRIQLFGNRAHPDEVARLATGDRRPPSDVELARYAAIPLRYNHLRPFGAREVPDEVGRDLVGGAPEDRVRVRPVPEQADALAGLLAQAAQVLRDDRDCQRELAAWTGAGDGGRPWLGLIRATTRVPDAAELALRLRAETVLLLETPGDSRADHLLAGQVMQETWLTATHAGLVGSVLTQPLHLDTVRAGLIDTLGLDGFPQALLRFGYPLEALPPESGQQRLLSAEQA